MEFNPLAKLSGAIRKLDGLKPREAGPKTKQISELAGKVSTFMSHAKDRVLDVAVKLDDTVTPAGFQERFESASNSSNEAINGKLDSIGEAWEKRKWRQKEALADVKAHFKAEKTKPEDI